ncbi:MAG: oxidoreductase [Frankiales bacterium]|nr:oxidoreductase [Frankiales bacterium]
MIQDLAGRRVVVTGGASGMGAGLVRALPLRGARVVSLDVTEAAGRAVAQAAGAHFVPVDVSEPDSVAAAMGEAAEHLGGLDVLVHAAGIAPAGSGTETEPELWDRVMAVNARGTYLTNRAAFPYLSVQGGRVLNFASAAGVQGHPGKAAYAASKGAVLAWTRTVAVEWAPYQITVNAIAPAIWTPMYDTTRASMSLEQLAAHDVMMAKAVPLGGRLGDVDRDLVPVIAFLCGDGARFMTGQVLAVDGGTLMLR